MKMFFLIWLCILCPPVLFFLIMSHYMSSGFGWRTGRNWETKVIDIK